jgi:hypothetical protein
MEILLAEIKAFLRHLCETRLPANPRTANPRTRRRFEIRTSHGTFSCYHQYMPRQACPLGFQGIIPQKPWLLTKMQTSLIHIVHGVHS